MASGYRIGQRWSSRGGQTLLFEGQIWKLFFIEGRIIQNSKLWQSYNFYEAEKLVFLCFYWHFLTKFLVVEDLCCFFSCQKKVHGPHFGHVWYIAQSISLFTSVRDFLSSLASLIWVKKYLSLVLHQVQHIWTRIVKRFLWINFTVVSLMT